MIELTFLRRFTPNTEGVAFYTHTTPKLHPLNHKTEKGILHLLHFLEGSVLNRT